MERQAIETTPNSLSDISKSIEGERREDNRTTTLYRVGSLAIGDRTDLCLIKNIGPNGMMVRTYCSMPEGSRVTVELKCGLAVSGRVSWQRDAHAGISFDEPVDVVDILSTATGAQRPRMPRILVNSFLMLRQEAFTYRVRVCDISQGGLKICCEKELLTDSHVVISMYGVAPQPSVVRWVDGPYVGITFNRMLALPVLVEWLRDQRDALRTVRAGTLTSSAQA